MTHTNTRTVNEIHQMLEVSEDNSLQDLYQVGNWPQVRFVALIYWNHIESLTLQTNVQSTLPYLLQGRFYALVSHSDFHITSCGARHNLCCASADKQKILDKGDEVISWLEKSQADMNGYGTN